MRFTGFISDHDPKVPNALPIGFMIYEYNGSEEDKAKTIAYLKQGHFVMGWMNVDHDVLDGASIGPSAYLTDGTFVWPHYYTFYLEKYPRFGIQKSFFEHIASNQFQVPAVSEERLKELEMELMNAIK